MPFSSKYRQDLDLVVTQVDGVVDDSLFAQYMLATESVESISEATNVLLVFDPDVQLNMSSDIIRETSRRPPAFGLSALRVIVAPSGVAFGLSRMFSLQAPLVSEQFRIVQTMEQAAEVLGIDVGDLIDGDDKL